MDVFGIVGAGVMGTDIAHIAAEAGFSVDLFDRNSERCDSSLNVLNKRFQRYVDNGRIDREKKEEVVSRISYHKHVEELCNADIVLECVDEDLDVKKSVFSELDRVCKGGTVLASNTSALSITELASVTKRPESVIGIHFLIPARVVGMVEIISGLLTTAETFEMAKETVKKLGKKYIKARDFPGFTLNRMIITMINEAICLIYEGNATVESIDKVMTVGLKQPMGPLALADLIGLDIVLAVMEEMYKGFADPKYSPCPLLKQYVAAGHLGVKSGKGFYMH